MASTDRNKGEKKRVGPLTSIWELTVSERKNAATIIENTTAKPFIYCRYYFKCFFCKQHYTDLTLLLQHTSTHQQVAKLAKGTRTIKVDITDLKCRICQQSFTTIDETREHLTKAHDKIFTKSGNGIMEYTLAPTNNQFRCHLCQKLFQTFILLNRHMNVHFNNAVCEICGSTFMSYQRLIQHKAIHTGGHPCSVCKKVYTTNANLKFHIERKHEQKQNTRMLRCSLCSERFTEHFRKLKHLKERHGVTFTFECEVCKSVFDSRRALTTHTNKQHSEKTKCDLCKKAFSCVTTLKLHLLSHTGERNYSCSVCNKAYRHKKNMSQHMKSHFGDNGSPKWFACPECVIGFACKSEFNTHMKQWHHKNSKPGSSIWQITAAERNNAAKLIQHTTVRPFIFMGSSFKCFFCLQYYSEIPTLLHHTSTHAPENEAIILKKYIPNGKRTLLVDISNLKCRQCDNQFPNLDSIKLHLQNSHGVRFLAAGSGLTEYNLKLENGMLSCHLCAQTFHNFTLLNCHMSGHVGKVVCENCGAGFLNQHLLIKHKECHRNKRFSCKFCDRVFYKKSQVKYHTEIVHKGKDRVTLKKCPHCSETFKEHYSKMIHLRTAHGFTKSFPCHLCQSTFSMRRALTEHITKFHTEKYKCSLCLKCYATEFRLKQHMRGHTGEKNFMCPVCKNTYMHKMSLKKHMKSHDS